MKQFGRAMPLAVLFLYGCAQTPVGPSIAVMPAPNKPFDVFVQEDQLCRSWAAHAIGLPGHEGAADALVGSALTGAAIGAIADSIDGSNRDIRAGAAMGTTIGAMAGTSQNMAITWESQRQYDIAYQQCMFTKGNRVSAYDYQSYPMQIAPPPPPPSPAPAPTK
jgi:hypothetical protein